jgi:hypothetical protein
MALSNAERQARWQANRKVELERLRKVATKAAPSSPAAGLQRKLDDALAEIEKLKAQMSSQQRFEAAKENNNLILPKSPPVNREYTNQQAERLKALWKSGRDKYQSFFAVLEEVRHEVGNDDLAAWCRDNLQIGISVIVNIRGILLKADAARAKDNLAAAAAANIKQKKQA